MPVNPERLPKITVPHLDKVVHFIMFFTLAALGLRSHTLVRQMRINLLPMIVIGLICISYGAIMEWLQGAFFNKRDSDIMDWVADVAGTFLGLWITSRPFMTNRFLFHPESKSNH